MFNFQKRHTDSCKWIKTTISNLKSYLKNKRKSKKPSSVAEDCQKFIKFFLVRKLKKRETII